ncbi:MAG: hypothetical protein JW702_04950 [Clostridiales bacterium]|nr:hypothetical protein [Clostridiales bacterium]
MERIMFHHNFKSITKILGELEKKLPGTTISYTKKDFGDFISVKVDAIIALRTYVILEKHLNSLLIIHETICDFLFLDSLEMLNQIRIDYRIDVRVELKTHRMLIMKLLNKTKHKYYHLKRGEIFKTTILLKNKSMELKLYDKEEERRAKGQKVRPGEECILRFEIALINGHLKYNKKKKGMPKELQTYMKEELHYEYMRKIVEVFFPGNFYYLLDAEAILEERHVKKTDREFVRALMVMMSEKGYEGVDKAYTPHIIKKCLKILREVNIHPVPIPKNEKVLGYSRENPLKNPVNDILRAIEASEHKAEDEKTVE